MIAISKPFPSILPHRRSSSDGQLEQRVTIFLATHAGIASEAIDIVATAGHITIFGHVATAEHKQAIETFSRRVAGVVSVDNRIRVQPRRDVGHTTISE